MHNHPNNNDSKFKLNNLYHNKRMKWMRNHGNLNLMLAHMNVVLVETWVAFKLSSRTITYEYFNNTRLIPISPPETCIEPQACLAATQRSNGLKYDDIESTAKATISPAYME